MTGFKKIFLTVAFVTMAVSLGGCETMDTAMQDVKERFASIDLTMPKVTPTNKGYDSKDESNSNNTDVAITKEETRIEIAPNETKEETVQLTSSKNCPSVSIIEELNSLHQFSHPDRPTPSEKISSITLTELKTGCKRNETNIVVEINMVFEGKLGPKARVWATDKPSFAYPYFMAITTPNGNIVAKEVFAATVSYNKDEQTVIHEESLRQIIPLNGEYNAKHEIMIGFQLTEGELAYNRALTGKTIQHAGNALPPAHIETSAGTEKPAAKPISITPSRKPQQIVIIEPPVEKEIVVEEIKIIEEKPEIELVIEPVVKPVVEVVEDSTVVEVPAMAEMVTEEIIEDVGTLEKIIEEEAVPAEIVPVEAPVETSLEPEILEIQDITAED